MTESITRRSFIKGSTVLGASLILEASAVGCMQKLAFAEGKVDIAAVKGADYFKNTIKAVEILGGMGKFVSKQSKVGLLINSPWDYPGSYVKPEMTLAVIQMCRDAGAKEIGVFRSLGDAYWQRSPLSQKFGDEVRSIRSLGGNYTEVSLPRGRSLKKAEIAKGLLDCDVFINIPIPKDHSGTRFTGTMKNMMGATSGGTNRFFHHGSGGSGYYDDVEFLSQCIADVNLVRKPDLCIVDGTEMITTNGPYGPGKLIKPQKVFAGVDRVAVDMYGANLLGVKGEEIRMIQMAHQHGLGEISLAQLQIQEVTL
ncbi:MAG: DUF362 domain-containing protein [Deltaproteobacteria bacterium]|nr:DUF362 domain-containing protein [Deltaproteobacteria bacterium]